MNFLCSPGDRREWQWSSSFFIAPSCQWSPLFQLANLAESWCLATILRFLCWTLKLTLDLLPIYEDLIAHLVKQCTCIISVVSLNPIFALKYIYIFFQAKIAVGFNCIHAAKMMSSIQKQIFLKSTSLRLILTQIRSTSKTLLGTQPCILLVNMSR